MDSRSIAFLEVMIGIAAAGLLAFLVFLVARTARRADITRDRETAQAPKWYEFLLPVVLLAAIAGVLVWQLAPATDAAAPDWRTAPSSLVFFIVMLVAGGLGLLAFLVFLFARLPGQPRTAVARRNEPAPEQDGNRIPSAARMLGLLLLGLGFLLVNWIYAPKGQQYAMMLDLVYPASLGVALVLLFDKATRSWSAKSTGETVREWLLCDGIVILLLLGFLNLLQVQAADKYAALFWDFLSIVLFFLTFWILDRTASRYRFLWAYGYLIVLPILLLIWRVVQKAPTVEGLSWWSTIWPFLILAIVFFVLEIIALFAARESEKHILPAIKDALFPVLYGILLIVAIPAAAK